MMSEVKLTGEYHADVTALVLELAALREELERQKRYVEINANSAHGKHKEGQQYKDERDALREELAHFKEGSQHLLKSLAAAEQRNAELKVFDQFVGYLLDHCEGETIYEESLQRWLAESIEKNKPTESGASA
jgi:hypothetical protein